MVRDGKADTVQHGRRTRQSLDYWFRQSERLNIARAHYELRGTRFTDFARRIGVDRASAFQLIKLYKHRSAILSDCREEEDETTNRGECYFIPVGAPHWNARKASNHVVGRLPASGSMARSQHERRTDLDSTAPFVHTPKVFLHEGDSLTLLRTMARFHRSRCLHNLTALFPEIRLSEREAIWFGALSGGLPEGPGLCFPRSSASAPRRRNVLRRHWRYLVTAQVGL
jgi:hypothetical protein